LLQDGQVIAVFRGFMADFVQTYRPTSAPQAAQRPLARQDGLVQRLNESAGAVQLQALSDRMNGAERANRTGLPDALKAGIESLSGISMDHTRVRYNSPKPAAMQAHAFTQGSEIHVAPGQEQHLAHEAWHVVQQSQGRVRPTTQLMGSVPLNDDADLEREADAMGARALSAAPRS
jgi:hypothetical protein